MDEIRYIIYRGINIEKRKILRKKSKTIVYCETCPTNPRASPMKYETKMKDLFTLEEAKKIVLCNLKKEYEANIILIKNLYT
jgi:hypothetical protein